MNVSPLSNSYNVVLVSFFFRINVEEREGNSINNNSINNHTKPEKPFFFLVVFAHMKRDRLHYGAFSHTHCHFIVVIVIMLIIMIITVMIVETYDDCLYRFFILFSMVMFL